MAILRPLPVNFSETGIMQTDKVLPQCKVQEHPIPTPRKALPENDAAPDYFVAAGIAWRVPRWRRGH
jgi:hypothetical protein